MKAAVYYENGPPSVLRYEEVADPRCHPRGIVIRVLAISVEGGDTLHRFDDPVISAPHIVGYQAAGEIVEVGSEVREFKTGQKVVTTGRDGSHAELRAVPARSAWPIPAGMDVKQAASVPIPFATADDCLFEFGRLREGQRVLIQAGGSAVGIAAIQLAKRAGATVFATASSEDKLRKLEALGLDHGIEYATGDLVQALRRVTRNEGVDLVVDPVGSTLPKSLACLAPRGRVSLVGRAGRQPVTINPATALGPNQSITRVSLAAEMGSERVRAMIARHLDDVSTGKLKTIIDREFPLSAAAEAHAYIESRRAFGRVLLIP